MLNFCFQGTQHILVKPKIDPLVVKVGCVKDSLMETQSVMDTEKNTTADQCRRRQLRWVLNAE